MGENMTAIERAMKFKEDAFLASKGMMFMVEWSVLETYEMLLKDIIATEHAKVEARDATIKEAVGLLNRGYYDYWKSGNTRLSEGLIEDVKIFLSKHTPDKGEVVEHDGTRGRTEEGK